MDTNIKIRISKAVRDTLAHTTGLRVEDPILAHPKTLLYGSSSDKRPSLGLDQMDLDEILLPELNTELAIMGLIVADGIWEDRITANCEAGEAVTIGHIEKLLYSLYEKCA